nr:hypothetical protein [Tanacetum cinerariifolium]
KPGVGYKATEDDITSNPKKLKLIQVEAVQLVRAYDDADLVQGYPAYIRLAKTFDAGSAILFDGLDHPEYVIQFVIKPDHKNDPPWRNIRDYRTQRRWQIVADSHHQPPGTTQQRAGADRPGRHRCLQRRQAGGTAQKDRHDLSALQPDVGQDGLEERRAALESGRRSQR